MIIILIWYEYTLVFRDTKAHANADALSWLPVKPVTTKTPTELVLLADHLKDSPVTEKNIKNCEQERSRTFTSSFNLYCKVGQASVLRIYM